MRFAIPRRGGMVRFRFAPRGSRSGLANWRGQALGETVVSSDVQERVAELERRIDRLNKDVDRLAGYIERLVEGVRMIEASRSWRVGRGVVQFAKRLLGRRGTLTFFRETDDLYEVFCHWRRSRD